MSVIDPTPGTIIDERYQVIRQLGEGGMGSVYVAIEIELNRQVAIKLLHPALLTDEEQRARFEREGRILSTLSHPNILTFFRFGMWQKTIPYIVMEYVEGSSLRDLIDQGQLSVQRCIDIALQMAEALQYAHDHNVVHRDIKPTNILVQNDVDGTIKILDFGLARVVLQDQPQHLTQTGDLIGSVFYMSPEQCTGKKADSRSDVYSSGCVMYEMCTGEPPFKADNPIGLMHLHANAKIPPICESANAKQIDKSVAQGLDFIVSKTMAKEPDERYQDMGAFKTDLELLRQGKLAPAAKSSVKSAKRSAKLAAGIGLLAVCGVVALATQHKVYFDASPTDTKSAKKQSMPHLVSFHAKVQSMTRLPEGETRVESALKLASEIQAGADVSPIEIKHVYFVLADDGRKFLAPKILVQRIQEGVEALKKAGADNHIMSLAYNKKAQALLSSDQYAQATEAAETCLDLLKKSDCVDDELESSAWLTMCDSAKFQGKDFYARVPQIEALLNRLQEKDYHTSYQELASKLAYIYIRNGNFGAEKRLFDKSMDFLRGAPIETQRQLMRNWFAVSYKFTHVDASMPQRLMTWLASIARSIPEKEYFTQVLVCSEILLSYSCYEEARAALDSVRSPDTAASGNLSMESTYRINKARALIWLGNPEEAAREIERFLRNPGPSGKNNTTSIPNLVAGCWRYGLQQFIEPLLNQYEQAALGDTATTPQEIAFQYTHLLQFVPPLKRADLAPLYLDRAERLIIRKVNEVPRSLQATMAMTRAQYLVASDQFDKGLALIEPFYKDPQAISNEDLTGLYATRALLLLYCNRDAEAARDVESYFSQERDKTKSAADLYSPIIDIYESTARYEKAEHYAREGLAQAADLIAKVTIAGKLAALFINSDRPAEAVELLSTFSAPKLSEVPTFFELGVWTSYHLKYAAALRRAGNLPDAYNQAQLACTPETQDRRVSNIVPLLEILCCTFVKKQTTQARAKQMSVLLPQLKAQLRKFPNSMYVQEFHVFESIELIDRGLLDLGLEKLDRALSQCLSEPDSFAATTSFKLAWKVYQELGKQAEAERSRAELGKALEQSRGKTYAKLHSSFSDQI